MKSTVRWAIVGPGIIARKFAKDLRVVEGAELHAIAGRDLARAQAFANEWGAATAYDDLHALAADPAVDIVYIAVPHPAHFPAAKFLLAAGKSVLCEKPLTVNAQQARELIHISQTKRVLLMEALWTRYLPVYAKVRQWIDEGRIGQPLIVSSALCIQPPIDPANRFFNPSLAGGGLLDVGIYSVAMSQLVMGRSPVGITAQARMTDTGVDEVLSASLQYESGGLAQFVCGIRPLFDNSLVIGGDKGLIRVPSRFIHGKEATIEIGGVAETFRLDHRSGGFEFQIEEAIRCLRSGAIESALMPHADSLANVVVMDAIRRQIGLHYPDETA